MAAKAAVAVDDHERAWSASKEKSEVLFNDCRRAAEEDAQRAGDGVKLETQTRLHRIVTQVNENERKYCMLQSTAISCLDAVGLHNPKGYLTSRYVWAVARCSHPNPPSQRELSP